jgi:hypothetical protein
MTYRKAGLLSVVFWNLNLVSVGILFVVLVKRTFLGLILRVLHLSSKVIIHITMLSHLILSGHFILIITRHLGLIYHYLFLHLSQCVWLRHHLAKVTCILFWSWIRERTKLIFLHRQHTFTNVNFLQGLWSLHLGLHITHVVVKRWLPILALISDWFRRGSRPLALIVFLTQNFLLNGCIADSC